MEEAFVAHLLAAESLSSLVESRIYWNTRPQGSPYPAIVMYVISRGEVDSDEGNAGLTETRVQVDCLGSTYASAKAVSRAVAALVSGKQFQRDAVKFDAVWHDSQREDYELGTAGESVHRVSVDYMVWHTG